MSRTAWLLVAVAGGVTALPLLAGAAALALALKTDAIPAPSSDPLADHPWWQKRPTVAQLDAILAKVERHSQGVVIVAAFGNHEYARYDRLGYPAPVFRVDGSLPFHADALAGQGPQRPRVNVFLTLPDSQRYTRAEARLMLQSALDGRDSEARERWRRGVIDQLLPEKPLPD